MKTFALSLILLLLTACGGGDLESGDQSFIGPPDCHHRPELCQ